MFHNLTIKQLETFFWVARLGSFSGAANRLNTTQPSVSIRIRDMEHALQVSLFDRRGRRPRLTPTGRELAGHVERIIELGEEFDHLLGLRDTISGLVRVGAADTVALTWLPTLMAELGRLYPAINVELIVDLSVNLRGRLQNGDLDIAFLVGGTGRSEFVTRSLGLVEQRWMCSPSLGLEGRTLRGQDLVAWPIFTHSRGSDHFRTVQRWFDVDGVRPQRLHGCNSLATMIAMTVSGLGLSVLPHRMLVDELAAGRLMCVETQRPVGGFEFIETYAAQPSRLAVNVVADLGCEIAGRSPVFVAKDAAHRPRSKRRGG